MSETSAPARVRMRLHYLGRVQGVFFRATAASLARERGVVGFVRNEADGSVRAEAEGPPERVAAFREALESHFRGNIRQVQASELPPRGEETEFEVRR
jgi:acylphosphatase